MARLKDAKLLVLVAAGLVFSSLAFITAVGIHGVRPGASTSRDIDAVRSTSAAHPASPAGADAIGPGGLGDWRQVGPEDVAGPISHVVYQPADARLAYAMTHGGDVYVSDDGGNSWRYRNHLPLFRGRLEPVPGRPGELYAYSAEYMQWIDGEPQQIPLFFSGDGGQTWLERRPSNWMQVSWLSKVSGLRVVPGRPNEIWAVGANGLLRSTDAGLSWALVYSQGASTVCSGLEVSVAASRAYTACRTPGWNVIAASLDGGGWTQLTQRSQQSSYARIAVAPSQPQVMYMATFGDGAESGYGAAYLGTILRTTDGGLSWHTRFDRSTADRVGRAIPGDFDFECSAPDHGALTSEHAVLAVDPANADSLWVAGFEIFRSDDGGASFGRVQARSDMVVDANLNMWLGLTRNETSTAIAFAPGYDGSASQRVMVSDAAGVRATSNARASAQFASTLPCGNAQALPAVEWFPRNTGFSGARVVAGEVGSAGEIVAGSPDFGIAITDGGSSGQWARITQAHEYTVGQISLRQDVGPLQFTSSWGSGTIAWRWDSGAGRWGAAQSNFATGNGLLPDGYSTGYYQDFFHNVRFVRFVRDVASPARLISGSTDGVYESRDGGVLWQLISPNVPVSAFGLRRDGRVVAATQQGHLLSQTASGSQQWAHHDADGCEQSSGTCTRDGLPFTSFVNAPNVADATMYATAKSYGNSRIWRSVDGRTWTAVDVVYPQAGALPRNAADVTLAIDTDNPRIMFAGMSSGLYVSEDGGSTWRAATTPFARTPVAKLQFVKEADGRRRLYAFTYGRGIWSAVVAPSTAFADVPTYHWAYDYVNRLFQAGITSGCTLDPLRYCPGQRVTRDQMAVFLVRATRGSTYQPPAATGAFADVPPAHWAAAWIEQLRAAGITTGCSATPLLYCPEAEVTRDQMAVFLLRARYGANYVPPPATGAFEDVPVQHWAAPWIEQLARDGATGGCSVTPRRYCPDHVVTRDQMAVLMVRTFGL